METQVITVGSVTTIVVVIDGKQVAMSEWNRLDFSNRQEMREAIDWWLKQFEN